MKILFVAGEVYPLAKTGGLADVVGALPKAFRSLGDEVRVMLPGYPEAMARVAETGRPLPLADAMGYGAARIVPARMPDSNLDVFLVDCPEAFARPGGPYQDADGRDWPDNARRFALLSRAAALLGVGGGLAGWQPDIVHAHDWQTGLVPVYMRQWGGSTAGSVFTIHNLHYQGVFPPAVLGEIGVDPALFTIDALEYWGNVSLLKAGLVFSDYLTTVSPTYAREIQTEGFGYGLDGVVRWRAQTLRGILNGIDPEIWSPEVDAAIAQPYSVSDVSGKARCKAALQAAAGLAPDAQAPLLGLLGRLVWQKGVDIVLDALPEIVEMGFQVVIQGAGEPALEARCREAAAIFAGKVAAHIGYDETFAHVIEAGADVLAVPSRFEPCGLTQMYALRYGTLPVVRRTGGLADSVADVGETPDGTGFVFDGEAPADFLAALIRARELYDRPAAWAEVRARGMTKDFSWRAAAVRYREVYEAVLRARRG
ncbi:glycogen synthase [uncultured Alphaproteobacteria bacterium]|uniref:Glycogen synthase n=1 Tax=uncultured Alphaproteobacteria bacterium TaxID=91750 RepID=A0A212JLN2_9PROT|nr:glycogen synthase [uncultured Alphaproteobacteria bacterium]